MDVALQEAQLAVVVAVSICDRSTFNTVEGMHHSPLLQALLSVDADDLSKNCKSAGKLATSLGLPDSSVFSVTYGATLMQLGLRLPTLNPKVYVRSLTTIGGRKHLVDAARIAASICPPTSTPEKTWRLTGQRSSSTALDLTK